jgi:hypothetical protein
VGLVLVILQTVFVGVTWVAPVTAVLVIVLRFMVTPNKTLEEAVDIAYEWGREDGEAWPTVVEVD